MTFLPAGHVAVAAAKLLVGPVASARTTSQPTSPGAQMAHATKLHDPAYPSESSCAVAQRALGFGSSRAGLMPATRTLGLPPWTSAPPPTIFVPAGPSAATPLNDSEPT